MNLDEQTLIPIATSSNQWTGLAVTSNSPTRIFASFPRLEDNPPISVAEIVNGKVTPYPNAAWQDRTKNPSFKAVHSLFIDEMNRLWLLDTNNPQGKGVQDSGPILYEFDLGSNTLKNTYTFNNNIYSFSSYFNRVVVDAKKNVAYISDSTVGAIVVLDLKTKQARRILESSPATKNKNNPLEFNGQPWYKMSNVNGIALSPDGKYLYFSALNSHVLYRIKTDQLLDLQIPDIMINTQVEKVGTIAATDDILFTHDGKIILGGIENDSIHVLDAKGQLQETLQNPLIQWASSFAQDADKNLYFITSQMNLKPTERYAYVIYQIKPENYLKNIK